MGERVNILGVGMSPVNMETALRTIEGWVSRREHHYVFCAPVHGIVDCQRDETLRRIYNRAGLVTHDGMPLVWVSRLMGHRQVERVYGPDLMLAACDRFRSWGCRHFLYGGWPGRVVDDLAARLASRFPGIEIVGRYSPPFRPLTPEEDAAVVSMINKAQPDLVWIGLGTAKEKYWARDHLGKLTAPVLLAVGAAFDFHSGTKPQAPRWVMRSGLEWLYRMVHEPRRLALRYLIDNPLFVGLIVLQALGRKPADL